MQEVDNFIKEIWALDADEGKEEMEDLDEGYQSDDSNGDEMDDDISKYINKTTSSLPAGVLNWLFASGWRQQQTIF